MDGGRLRRDDGQHQPIGEVQVRDLHRDQLRAQVRQASAGLLADIGHVAFHLAAGEVGADQAEAHPRQRYRGEGLRPAPA